MGIRLSRDEAWDVLQRTHTGILTTLRVDGSPITLPVWFVPLDHTICFSTPHGTKKISRLRRDPRASFLVESGLYWVELKAVHLTGLIEEVQDGASRGRIEEALSEKYDPFKTARQKMPESARETYSDSARNFLPADSRRPGLDMGQQPNHFARGGVSDLLVSDDEGIRTITFDRPEARNALTVSMRQALFELIGDADLDPSVKAIVLTGTDPAFTAGVDFKESTPSFDPRARRFTANPGRVLRATRTPVVSAVNGACVSGGMEIALSCSFIVASERAQFADTHARLNVVPAWGLTALLPRAVGTRKAFEMSATGNFIGAQEAARIGLVNHVVAHDELMAFTTELVRSIVDTPAMSEVRALPAR